MTGAVAPAAQGLRAATMPNKKHGAGTILALIALVACNEFGVPPRPRPPRRPPPWAAPRPPHLGSVG